MGKLWVFLSFLNPRRMRDLIHKVEKEKKKLKIIRRPRGDKNREVKK